MRAKSAALLKAGRGKRFLWMDPFAGDQKNKELCLIRQVLLMEIPVSLHRYEEGKLAFLLCKAVHLVEFRVYKQRTQKLGWLDCGS